MYSLVPFRRAVVNTVPSLFNDPFLSEFFTDSSKLSMHVDVQEQSDAFLLETDLPGVGKENIQLRVDDGTLTIGADINMEKKERKAGYVFNERRSGHVERSFNLENIDVAGIKADYKNGVLTVLLPKLKEAEKPAAQTIAIGDGETLNRSIEAPGSSAEASGGSVEA